MPDCMPPGPGPRALAALAALLLAGGCESEGGEPPAPVGPRGPGIDLSALDRGTSPCRDFYQFACGGWLARNPLNESESFNSTNLDPFYAQVEALDAIIQESVRSTGAGQSPEGRLIGSHHQACLAAPARTESRQRLAQLAGMVDAVGSLDDLARLMATYAQLGSAGFVAMYVSVDPGNAARHVLTLDSAAGELPDPSYYLEPRWGTLRQRYLEHIAALARLVGVGIDPAAVLAVETELETADVPWPARRDLRALHNPMTIDELAALAPRFPWRVYLEARGFAGVDRIDVLLPSYVAAFGELIARRSLEELKAYLRWQIIEDKAFYLDQAFVDEEFSFHDREFSGVSAPQPRDWTCYLSTTQSLGFELARQYVERFFAPGTRQYGQMLVQQIKAAMRRRLQSAAWLDEPTRAEAVAKLEKVADKIGYPDTWPASLPSDVSGTWLDLLLARSQAYHALSVARLAQPVDRTAWFMPPIEVNAYYAPQLNEMVFPAAIFRLPFFDPDSGVAANYGAIGSVMGHELTHAFDDTGRQFDGDGNLRNWWSPMVETAFADRSRCVVDQFSRYEPLPGQRVDGSRTLGENLADLGGLTLAFDAWKSSGMEPGKMAEFDGAQQFFVAHAQAYCTAMTPALLSTLLLTDPHSPPRERVNGPLSQLESFAAAFQCPADAPMRARPVCEVW